MKKFYARDGIEIYHGDARSLEEQLPLVDFIFTDPPYGHNFGNGDLIAADRARYRKDVDGKKWRTIKNDSPELATKMARWLFEMSARKLRCCCCCCCCCCGGGGPDPQFARWSLWMDEVLNFKQMVVWDKGPMGMGWHYRRSYEVVLVGQKGKGKCRWMDRSHRIENVIRPGMHGIKKIIPSRRQHPTEKPVALAEFFIGLHSRRGDLVFDPFMGGGSTLVAAKRMGRRAIGVDLEKRWCRLAAERLEALRGV